MNVYIADYFTDGDVVYPTQEKKKQQYKKNEHNLITTHKETREKEPPT